jgi:hypothetical protein
MKIFIILFCINNSIIISSDQTIISYKQFLIEKNFYNVFLNGFNNIDKLLKQIKDLKTFEEKDKKLKTVQLLTLYLYIYYKDFTLDLKDEKLYQQQDNIKSNGMKIQQNLQDYYYTLQQRIPISKLLFNKGIDIKIFSPVSDFFKYFNINSIIGKWVFPLLSINNMRNLDFNKNFDDFFEDIINQSNNKTIINDIETLQLAYYDIFTHLDKEIAKDLKDLEKKKFIDNNPVNNSNHQTKFIPLHLNTGDKKEFRRNPNAENKENISTKPFNTDHQPTFIRNVRKAIMMGLPIMVIIKLVRKQFFNNPVAIYKLKKKIITKNSKKKSSHNDKPIKIMKNS